MTITINNENYTASLKSNKNNLEIESALFEIACALDPGSNGDIKILFTPGGVVFVDPSFMEIFNIMKDRGVLVKK